MNKNINIAELLKDCPQGMKLYSPLCGKCVFDHLNMGTIICKKQNNQEIAFTSEGYYMLPVFDDCECMIFPSKDQRDWNRFQRPFKDNDKCYMYLSKIVNGIGSISFKDQDDWELATYQVGDHFIHPTSQELFIIIKILNDGNYYTKSNEYPYVINKHNLNKYFKVSKWNPKWLKPFDRVLIRDSQHDSWTAVLFSHIGNIKEFPYVTSYAKSRYCIPYNIETKHLVGTSLEEPEFYKL